MGSGTDQSSWAEAPEGGTNPSGNGGAGPPAGAGWASPAGEGPGEAPAAADDGGTVPHGATGTSTGTGAGTGTGTGTGTGEGAGESAGLGDGVPAPEADLASLLVGVEHQRDEYLEALRRLQAEFDNYRKRIERQQRDVGDNAVAAIVKELLPVLDTADLALAHGAGEDIKHVTGALFDILSKQGLERIDPEGQPFDPEHHEAVAHEPAEGAGAPERPEVSEVMRAGYHWRGRVLRPAMVKVRG
jgi:molecular chaperone GrpE